MRAGQQVDRWTLVGLLGNGASGQVWAAKDGAGRKVALKILKMQRPGRYIAGRFRDEIELYRRLGDRPGVLPLVDSSIPAQTAEASAGWTWLAMEIATPIVRHLGPRRSLASVVEAIRSYAETLTALAEEDIYHRDIKPTNLYWAEGSFLIGDFGIADFPDKAGLTRPGRKLGPENFLAPEMIDYSGDVASGPADVYSLAKTLWVMAAHRRYPPPGELRRDRAMLQLSSYVDDARARMLEGLLERATAHDPSVRPSMREVAEELSWWGEPWVATRVDLSSYAEEVSRLRAANEVRREETKQHRPERHYNEALSQVFEGLFSPLNDAVESAGLRPLGSPGPGVRDLDGWPPHPDYGGSSHLPRWGIDTLASPWLAGSVGVVHRSYPDANLEDLMVTVVLALMTPESQHNYLQITERFRPDSLGLDRIIETLRAQIDRQLPDIIAHFLATCKKTGVPR